MERKSCDWRSSNSLQSSLTSIAGLEVTILSLEIINVAGCCAQPLNLLKLEEWSTTLSLSPLIDEVDEFADFGISIQTRLEPILILWDGGELWFLRSEYFVFEYACC